MAKSSTRRRTGGSSVFTGVMIGLIVGLVLAVAVAIWVMGSNPFKEVESQPTAPAAPAVPATPDMPPVPEAAPSFDFYKVLPGEPQPLLPPAPAAAPAPRLYLQAGAFQSPADADNLKASLALLGIEASIQTSDLAEKGIFHRVRIGPLDGMDEVERTRALLTQNNIPAVLVKEVHPSQEMP